MSDLSYVLLSYAISGVLAVIYFRLSDWREHEPDDLTWLTAFFFIPLLNVLIFIMAALYGFYSKLLGR